MKDIVVIYDPSRDPEIRYNLETKTVTIIARSEADTAEAFRQLRSRQWIDEKGNIIGF